MFWVLGFRLEGLYGGYGSGFRVTKGCIGVDSVGLDRLVQGYFEFERVIKGGYKGGI